MFSPPPSPPEDWAPIHEDICRTPYVDLEPEENGSLLRATPAHPGILVDEPEHRPRQKGNNT